VSVFAVMKDRCPLDIGAKRSPRALRTADADLVGNTAVSGVVHAFSQAIPSLSSPTLRLGAQVHVWEAVTPPKCRHRSEQHLLPAGWLVLASQVGAAKPLPPDAGFSHKPPRPISLFGRTHVVCVEASSLPPKASHSPHQVNRFARGLSRQRRRGVFVRRATLSLVRFPPRKNV
jgi:hypothetical protein